MILSLFLLTVLMLSPVYVSAQENNTLAEPNAQEETVQIKATAENLENNPQENAPQNQAAELEVQEVTHYDQEDLQNIEAFEEELAENMEEQVAVWTVQDVEKLHDAGLNFNIKDFKQNTILYYALSRNNSSKVIEKIVEYGADVNEFAANGMVPFNVITSKANELQLQILMMKTMGLDMSDPRVENELETKVFREMSRMLELAAFLIDNGADVNKESVLGTPLMNAVTNKWNVEIINLLIKYGADVNKQDKNGRTALFYAFLSGNDDIVTQLIQYGADTEIKDNNGQTYLEIDKAN